MREAQGRQHAQHRRGGASAGPSSQSRARDIRSGERAVRRGEQERYFTALFARAMVINRRVAASVVFEGICFRMPGTAEAVFRRRGTGGQRGSRLATVVCCPGSFRYCSRRPGSDAMLGLRVLDPNRWEATGSLPWMFQRVHRAVRQIRATQSPRFTLRFSNSYRRGRTDRDKHEGLAGACSVPLHH